MSFLRKAMQTALDLAALPVDLVKDVATMGGACTYQDEPYTVQRLRAAARHATEAYDDLEDEA